MLRRERSKRVVDANANAKSGVKTPPQTRRSPGELLSSMSAGKPRAAVRRAVTGDPDTRVRDYVHAKIKVPKVMRRIDKWSFCAGVYGLMFTEYVATRFPERFWVFYGWAMPCVVVVRAVYYRMIRWQYFLYDFCYFANIACFLFLTVRTSDATMFRCIFAFANGPVLLAIPLWRNSLVFHSVDKVHSVFVHAMPCLMTWCGRWYGFGDDERRLSVKDMDATTLTVYQGCLDLMVYPMFAYLFWQGLYLLKTEIIDRGKLERHPELMTSLRWLANDRNSPANKFALKSMRNIGLFGADEFFDAESTKTKFVFVTFQLCYTIITFIPIPFCYSNYYAHTALMWLAFGSSVYNGACYYIDVFSRKYVERLELAEKLIENATEDELNHLLTPVD